MSSGYACILAITAAIILLAIRVIRRYGRNGRAYCIFPSENETAGVIPCFFPAKMRSDDGNFAFIGISFYYGFYFAVKCAILSSDHSVKSAVNFKENKRTPQ